MATNRVAQRTKHPGIFTRDGKYLVVYRVDGRQRRRTFSKLIQARKFQDTNRADQARGEFFEASQTEFRKYAAEWVESYHGRSRGFRESTRTDYRSALELYAFEFFGRKRLCDIHPPDLAKLVAWLCDAEAQGKRLSDSRIRNIVAPIRSCFATAVDDGLVRMNPAQRVRLPNRDQAVEDGEGDAHDLLSREQLSMLLTVLAHRPKYQLLVRFLTETGLRIGEAIALEWRHIDLEAGEVRVRRSLYRGTFGPPKTRYGKRDVPIPGSLVLALQRHKASSEFDGEEDPVFASERGTPLSGSNVRSRVMVPAAKELDAPCVTRFHTFRHTFASLTIARNRNNIVQLSRILGHHSPEFTYTKYAHLIPGDAPAPLSLDEELRAPPSDGQHPDNASHNARQDATDTLATV